MNASAILPLLSHDDMHFVCRNLRERENPARFRVPLCHKPLPCFFLDEENIDAGKAALGGLPELPSTAQLRCILHDGRGLGLWVPRLLVERGGRRTEDEEATQTAAGSLLVYAPADWDAVRGEMKDWFFEGLEEAFRGLPYEFDDILPFAGTNFTPDRWYLVLRGPMAGKVCWWTHDGESEMAMPWAADIEAWGSRVCTELPDVFGGIIRFSSAATMDIAPVDAALYPLDYQYQIEQ